MCFKVDIDENNGIVTKYSNNTKKSLIFYTKKKKLINHYNKKSI